MRRRNPDHQMDIPISLKVYHQLIAASNRTGYEKEDWEIAAEAIDEWVRRHNPDTIAMPAATGYQWKGLFLPDGTLLRTIFGGKNYHCLVEGDRILYNGNAVSPSGFVNGVGGIRRNAWRCTWILLPDSKDWKLADTLRTKVRPRRVRTPEADIPPAPAHEAPDVLRTIHEQVPLSHKRGERRNLKQANGILHSSPGFMDRAERRTNGNARMVALLRLELLQLLDRMCALDGDRPDNAPRAP